ASTGYFIYGILQATSTTCKNFPWIFVTIKKTLLLQSCKVLGEFLKISCDEKDISAIKQEKKEQTRF
ncbi:MAG: hypothetical protein ACQER7_14950, partial [Bacteroidota bacterium]